MYDLTTLPLVKGYLGIVNDTTKDGQITAAISAASAACENYCNRQFVTRGDSTRRYSVGVTRGIVNLDPWELETPTAVTLNPEAGSPITLTRYSDYVLEPGNSPNGTYYTLRLSPILVRTAIVAIRFGYSYVDVAGTWGMPVIPEDVQWAATVAAAAFVDRAAAAYAIPTAEDGRQTQPLSAGAWLPWSTRQLLTRYVRLVA